MSANINPEPDLHLAHAEERLMRQQLRNHIVSMIPICVLSLVLAVQPFREDLAHLRAPAIPMVCIAGTATVCLKLAAGADKSKLEGRSRTAGQVHLFARVLVHIVCIIFDADSSHLFLKVLSMVWLPTAAVKVSFRVSDFKRYLVVHNIIVLLRFYGSYQDAGAWLITTLFLDKILLDLAQEVEAQRETRSALEAAHGELGSIAETTTKHLFQRFCDSTATLGDDLRISEPAPQLAAMLGLPASNTEGREFSSLVDGADAQRFISHMEAVASAPQSKESKQCAPDYIQVSLLDAFTKPVPVHIFHACFRTLGGKTTYFMGISETWRPPKTKQHKPFSSRRPGVGTARHSAAGGTASHEHDEVRKPSFPETWSFLHDMKSTVGVVASAAKRRYSPRPGLDRPQDFEG